MDTYTFLRAFADSWHLLFLFCFFIGVMLWVIRPGSRAVHEDTSNIPFRYDELPADPEEDRT